MEQPGATWMDRYRLERLVVADDAVTLWEVSDLRDGRRAQLCIFHHGSTVLHQGTIDDGAFVVVDTAPRDAPHLELVEIEDEPVDFPAGRRRGRIWAAGVLGVIAIAVLGLYVGLARPAASSEATITSAPIDVPTPATVEPPPPAPPPVRSASPASPPRTRRITRRAPRHHAPASPKSDPLTL